MESAWPSSTGNNIFGMFRRLHSDGYEGTGIGLAICERIVKTYGGPIWVEIPGEGKGSEFHFLLPAEAGHPFKAGRSRAIR